MYRKTGFYSEFSKILMYKVIIFKYAFIVFFKKISEAKIYIILSKMLYEQNNFQLSEKWELYLKILITQEVDIILS